jgi:hypothetical protein
MNIILDTKNFDIENVQLLDKKNNIITEGNFIKIIYSNSHFTMSGVYLYFPIQLNNIKNNIGYFNYNENKNTIDKIIEIETSILNIYLGDKLTEYKKMSIGLHLKNGTIKLNTMDFSKTPDSYKTTVHRHSEFANLLTKQNYQPRTHIIDTKKCEFIIKLSGIWENQNTVGITHKIYEKYTSDNLLNFSI